MSTIVLADDDESVRALLARALRAPGRTIVEVEDGDQALDASRARNPDLLIVDAGLPGRDGCEVVRLLREDPLTRELPIIMISGALVIPRELPRGPDLFFSKPFECDELVGAVAALLAAA